MTVIGGVGQAVPSVGVSVVFIDDQSTQIVMTDANGRAQADVRQGASVSVVSVGATHAGLVSILATKPGDNITTGGASLDLTAAGTFSVYFTAEPLPNDEVYDLYQPCGFDYGTTSPIALTQLRNTCVAAPMEISFEGALDGQPAYSNISNVPFVSGGSATMPPLAVEPTFTGVFTNIPANTDASFGRDSGHATNGRDVAAGSTSATLTMPGVVGTTASFSGNFGTGDGRAQVIVQQTTSTTSEYDLDVGTSLLAWVGDPTIDQATNDLDVTVTPVGTSNDPPDLAIAYLQLQAGSIGVDWTIIGPDPSHLTLPALPATFGVTGGMLISAGVESYEIDSVDGYDDARQHPAVAGYKCGGVPGQCRESWSPTLNN